MLPENFLPLKSIGPYLGLQNAVQSIAQYKF